mmetsp:Transcript_7207/g.9238  ORF Transcript_7207/g.9238 Transcript_7207/m.9238 type:complete len:86 (-) Transcript_7207:1125-1382(-)
MQQYVRLSWDILRREASDGTLNWARFASSRILLSHGTQIYCANRVENLPAWYEAMYCPWRSSTRAALSSSYLYQPSGLTTGSFLR